MDERYGLPTTWYVVFTMHEDEGAKVRPGQDRRLVVANKEFTNAEDAEAYARTVDSSRQPRIVVGFGRPIMPHVSEVDSHEPGCDIHMGRDLCSCSPYRDEG